MALRGITTPALPAEFLTPDSQETDPMVSYELGGIALNDPSKGRDYQVWQCYLELGIVKVAPMSGSPVSEQFTVTGTVTSLSLAFDSNMVPTIAYVENGIIKLYWFDSLIQDFVTNTVDGATECKVATDEKRSGLEGLSDVIFAYLKPGALYYRQQRDRYLIEYEVGGVPIGYRLIQIGKNELNRFQFKLAADSL